LHEFLHVGLVFLGLILSGLERLIQDLHKNVQMLLSFRSLPPLPKNSRKKILKYRVGRPPGGGRHVAAKKSKKSAAKPPGGQKSAILQKILFLVKIIVKW